MSHIDPEIAFLTIFILSIFVGYYVIWSVTPALHAPLMSVTNAISSVIVIGGIVAVSRESSVLVMSLGLGAIFLGCINIGGGFYVTARMLSGYKIKNPRGKKNA